VVARLSTYPLTKSGEATRRDQLVAQFEDVARVGRIAELDAGKLAGFLQRYAPVLDETRTEWGISYYKQEVRLDAAEVAAARRVVQALISLAVRTAVRRRRFCAAACAQTAEHARTAVRERGGPRAPRGRRLHRLRRADPGHPRIAGCRTLDQSRGDGGPHCAVLADHPGRRRRRS
jgi:hypothetical protein